MRLLLDTHVWIWRLLEPARVSPHAEAALADGDSEIHLSPISAWETLVLARKGRLALEPDAVSWIRTALGRSATVMAPLTHEVAIRSESLPGYASPDPADRFLVATALAGDMTLVTSDQTMLAYKPLRTIW